MFLVEVFGIFKLIPVCDERRGLTKAQVKLCYTYRKHMAYVLDGSRIAMDECRKQFAGRRWNCTFPRQGLTPFLHPQIKIGTKEAAFIHSIVAAGAMHTISRACMENKLSKFCGCSKEGRPDDLPKTQLWRGCGDNLPYAYKFSKQFIDASEMIEDKDQNLQTFSRVLMNLHNNEAGRWAVFEKSRIQCRCHGVSKNCATKMCYRQLAEFKVVGQRLQELHQSSIKVKLSQVKEETGGEGLNNMKLEQVDLGYNTKSRQDLVYVDDSPSYCIKGDGIFGTLGRTCQRNEKSLNDCSLLCCGRGHHTKRQIVKENCGCKFVWCCEVKCQTCEKEQNVHYCK